MNEQLDSQLSAMLDGELPDAECELFARRLSKDEALKARLARYTLIGAALRAERGVRPALAKRVTQALGNEAPLTLAAPAPQTRAPRPVWQTAMASAALAAGITAATMLWMRPQAPQLQPAPLSASTVSPAHDKPDAYLIPAATTRKGARSIVVPGTQLANYMVAHFQFSSPVAGQALLSALVGGETGTGAAAAGSEDRVPGEDVQDDAKTTVE